MSTPTTSRTGRDTTRTEHGMTTAEYAFGIIAAVGFACLLFLLADFVSSAIQHVVGTALSVLSIGFSPFGAVL